MSALDLPPVSAGEFKAEAALDGNAIAVRCAGNADLRAREAVESLLVRVDSQAQRLGAAEVVVDLRELEFMNSSCFKSFVSWIGRVQDLAPAAQYRIRLRSNPKMHWQQRSLHALRCFAVELISIEV